MPAARPTGSHVSESIRRTGSGGRAETDLALVAPFRRVDALRALAVAACAGVPLVLFLARAEAPRDASLAALLTLAPTLASLAFVDGRGDDRLALRSVLLVIASLCVAPLGWFFGPNAGVVAAVALLALLTGLLSRPGAAAWSSALVLTIIAGGQAVVTMLVIARVLPDVSLAPVIIAGHPDWQHAAAHAAAQLVIVGAFFAGRALRDRYADVHARMERSTRAIAIQSALLDEARQDYRRAVRTARAAESSTPRVSSSLDPATRASTPPARDTASDGTPSPETREGSTASTTLWMDAHRGRMELQHAAVLALCAIGIAFLAAIGRNPIPTIVGLAAMSLIALLAVAQREIARRRGDEAFYVPYTIIGALSVGPAFAFGLHSAFACVIAALLFFGGAFRAQASAARVGRRVPVYLAVAVSHGVCFALVWSDLIADAGNQPILVEGHAPLEPLVLHALLQATYAAAFLGGNVLDARFQRALHDAAHAEASLRASTEDLRRTSAQIASLLEETERGLFTGQQIGRYRVGSLIASGGLGDVYEAVREGDGAAIALKLVRSDRAAEPIALELLAREASALARVASPCVATILEAGLADEDLPFVAMERIEGPSLADVLRAEGRLEGEVLRELVRDLCRGIRDVHDAGVVHRDLKPHNVMRARDADGSAQWKIVDFGLALHGVSGGAHTVGGTAAYVAPEQALGERVDPRADLYSACLVVYRALTGRPAFVGDDPREVALRARSSGPPDPRGLVSLSRELELVLRVGLAADPRDRFATARELSTALTNALDGAISDAHRTRGEALLARAPWAPAR